MRRYLARFTSYMRRRRSLGSDQLSLLGLDIPVSIGRGSDHLEQERAAQRLAAMPVFVRETYLLRMVDKMSIEEISIRLAITPRSTRRNLRRAIAILAADPGR